MSEQGRSDSFRAGRRAPTGSARREKEALHPAPGRGRRRLGATSLATHDAAGGSTSQILDPTQSQQQHYQQEQSAFQHAFQPAFHYQQEYDYQQYHAEYQGGIRLSNSTSSLLSSSSMTSRSMTSSSMQSLLWRLRMEAFQGGLTTCLFYRTSVDMWHASFGPIQQCRRIVRSTSSRTGGN